MPALSQTTKLKRDIKLTQKRNADMRAFKFVIESLTSEISYPEIGTRIPATKHRRKRATTRQSEVFLGGAKPLQERRQRPYLQGHL